jgi:hypothetical protein
MLKLVSVRMKSQAETAVIPPVRPAAKFAIVERSVRLCLQAEGTAISSSSVTQLSPDLPRYVLVLIGFRVYR